MRFLLCCLLALPVLAQERPTFTCHRTNVNPRAMTAGCEARGTGSTVPTWRLYGASEEMLTDFNEGFSFRFDVPQEWRMLEMRVETDKGRIAVRVWVRGWRGKVQWRRMGDEGAID